MRASCRGNLEEIWLTIRTPSQELSFGSPRSWGVSRNVEARYAIDVLSDGAGGLGYPLKDHVLGPADLADAIRRVGNGGTAIDPQVVEHLLRRRRDDQRLGTLTPREREVLASLAEGRSNRSVAQELHVSEKTVEACTGRSFTKLDLDATPDSHRRVRAVLAYLRQTSS